MTYTLLNQSFRPMRAHNPNGTSVGSTVFAQTQSKQAFSN